MPLETLTITGFGERSSSGRNACVTRTTPNDVGRRRRARDVVGRDLGHGHRSRRDPGVVDEHVERADGLDRAATLASSVTSSCDEARAQLLGGGAAALRVARADPDVVALGDQPPRGLVAEAPVGSGDQGRGHAIQGVPRPPRDHQRTLSATLRSRRAPSWRHGRPRRLPAHLARPARARPRSGCRVRPPPRARACAARRSRELAGLSVDYLARLEQGRASAPSPRVLAPLARALRLSEDERGAPVPRRRPGAARRRADRPPHHAGRPARARPARRRAGDGRRRGLGDDRHEPARDRAARRRATSANILRRHFSGEPSPIVRTPEEVAQMEEGWSPTCTPPPAATRTTSRCAR